MAVWERAKERASTAAAVGAGQHALLESAVAKRGQDHFGQLRRD